MFVIVKGQFQLERHVIVFRKRLQDIVIAGVAFPDQDLSQPVRRSLLREKRLLQVFSCYDVVVNENPAEGFWFVFFGLLF